MWRNNALQIPGEGNGSGHQTAKKRIRRLKDMISASDACGGHPDFFEPLCYGGK